MSREPDNQERILQKVTKDLNDMGISYDKVKLRKSIARVVELEERKSREPDNRELWPQIMYEYSNILGERTEMVKLPNITAHFVEENESIMSREPYNQEGISLLLSEVLNDIGMSREILIKRRNIALFYESIINQSFILCKVKAYMFGSQTEGSTVPGLNSDMDVLHCLKEFSVINDILHQKEGMKNLLMIQDGTPPGYCLLQILDNNPHYPLISIDDSGRNILHNTYALESSHGEEQHGPALTRFYDIGDLDRVPAMVCDQWPSEAQDWLNRNNIGGWPDRELKDKCRRSGCFVVSVSSKLNPDLQNVEYRISTSLSERYLMFSLNNIQEKCYLLLKVLVKSNVALKEKISSFMCKTALFHSVEKTPSEIWRENNLLNCFKHTVWLLYNFVYYRNCPHFIIPGNNLLAGKLAAAEREAVLKYLMLVLHSEGMVLFEIDQCNLGERLNIKKNVHISSSPRFTIDLNGEVLGHAYHESAQHVLWSVTLLLDQYFKTFTGTESIQRCIQVCEDVCKKLISRFRQSSTYDQQSYKCIMPLFCTLRGSLLASYYKALKEPLPHLVWDCLEKGCESDVSSGRLKLATVCYSVGELERAEKILREVDQDIDRNVVVPMSGYVLKKKYITEEFRQAVGRLEQISDFRQFVLYSVIFLPEESPIIPQELEEEYTGRFILGNNHHVQAVVDSLPYLYFLQYKTYGKLSKRRDQEIALRKLQDVIYNYRVLYHKPTAFNLLGQLMEQENLPQQAKECYRQSLSIKADENAANLHLSRLLKKKTSKKEK